MMNQRKELVANIAMMENRLVYQQARVRAHKKYLINVVNNHWAVIITTLLPAFLWGWERAKDKGFLKLFNPIIKVGLFTFLSHIKKQYLSIHKR